MVRGAAELVWQAVCDPLSYNLQRAQLSILDAGAAEAAALLPYLAGVRVERWSGICGQDYRDYVGRLPCGPLLRVHTDAGPAPGPGVPGGGGR
jgi:hypothetical protein